MHYLPKRVYGQRELQMSLVRVLARKKQHKKQRGLKDVKVYYGDKTAQNRGTLSITAYTVIHLESWLRFVQSKSLYMVRILIK